MDIYTPNFDATMAYIKEELTNPDLSDEGRGHWEEMLRLIENPAENPYGDFAQLSEDGTNVNSVIFTVLSIGGAYKYPDTFLELNELLISMQSQDGTQTMDIFFSKASITRENAQAQVAPVMLALHAIGTFVE